MTSPNSAGSVSVEVLADARRLAKSLRSEVEKAFKDLDVSKSIQDSVGGKSIKLKVDPQVDTTGIGDKVKQTRVPKVPVELDPVVAAFQQEVRRQVAALSRSVNVNVPVEGDTSGLRARLGAELGAIQAQSKIKVPTEPGDKTAYEARLKAQLAEVAARVKQNVKVDIDTTGGRGRSGSPLGGLSSSALSALKAPVGALQEAFRGVSQAMQESSNAAVRFGGTVAGSLGQASGPVGAIVAGFALIAGGIAGIVGAATVAIPAVTALAGALAALPGILAGAGAGFGTLALGFKGISDAFKPKAGGGGGGGGGGEDAASRARRIAGAERGVEAARRGIASATRALQSANRSLQQAERGVADAQERVADAQQRALKAQQAVNRARKEAKEDIEDLGRALRGAVLDEEDAALSLLDAERALNIAREQGNLPDIQRAELEYRKAQLAVENAKDSTEDLGEAAKEANDKGVEGSDKVQDALQDQVDANDAVRDAIRGVADAQIAVIEAQNGVLSANDALKSSYDGLASAQDALAEAQKKAAKAGGGAGGLKDIVKLAPEAQKFVNAIKALKPAFEALRLDVQNRLFKNLDDTVRQVGSAWLPALRTTLGSYADTFNRFFRDLGTSISQPKFISDLQAGAESSRKALADIGKSVTTSLVPAFGALSRAAGPFIETLGKEIAGIVTEFSNWVLEGERTGGLRTFFTKASEALHDIFATGKQVGKLIGNIFRILTNGNGKNDKSAIDSFNEGLQSINRYLEDPANQAAIAGFVDDIKQFFTDIARLSGQVSRVFDTLFGGQEDTKGKASSLGNDIGKALLNGLIAGAIAQSGFWAKFAVDQFLNGPLSLIGSIRRVLGIASPSTVMAEIGGNLIDGLIQGIGDKFGALRAKVTELPGVIRKGIGNAATILSNAGKNVTAGLANGVVSLYGALRTRVLGLRTTVTNVFAGAASLLSNAGRNVTAGLANGIVALYGALRSRAVAMRTAITNALSNAGRLLYNAGRAVISGLINGIASLVGTLGNYLNQIGSFIQNNKGPIEKDRKLLVPAGQAIMQGLIGGIASKRDALGAQLSDLTGMVSGTSFPDLGANADAAISRSLSVAGANSLQASWAPGTTGDPILDALRKSIKFSHNGSVEAALGSS